MKSWAQMSDDFFDKHENSLLNFVAGLAVIMFIMFGGGILWPSLIFLLQQLMGEFTSKEFSILFLVGALVISLCITIPNVMITRGKVGAAKFNKINIYIQYACYLLLSLVYEDEYKWISVGFVIFPLLAHWLMVSAKYKAFLAFYEALRKDPEGFREKLKKADK